MKLFDKIDDIISNKKEIYVDILEHFGLKHQITKTIEECSELICALSRLNDDRSTTFDVITEIADVQIMLEQLKLYYGTSIINEEIKRKLDRVKLKMIIEDEQSSKSPQTLQ